MNKNLSFTIMLQSIGIYIFLNYQTDALIIQLYSVIKFYRENARNM